MALPTSAPSGLVRLDSFPVSKRHVSCAMTNKPPAFSWLGTVHAVGTLATDHEPPAVAFYRASDHAGNQIGDTFPTYDDAEDAVRGAAAAYESDRARALRDEPNPRLNGRGERDEIAENVAATYGETH